METLQKTGARMHPNTTMNAARALVKKANISNEPISLAKNEIIRGLVTDLRPGIVKIHLANKQAVVATLEGANEVSIGDVAAFKILENENGKLTLKKLNTNVSAKEATIQKALEEADLPTTDVNHAIVKELLYHKLPINKETINDIIKRTEEFPNAEVDTIVYLVKNGIEPDASYLEHFESYKHFDHRLIQHIDQIGEQLDIFLKSAALRENGSAFLTLASSVFDFLDVLPIDLSSYLEAIALEEENSSLSGKEEASAQEAAAQEGAPATEEVPKSPVLKENDLLLTFTGKEQKQLQKLFSCFDLPDEYLEGLKSGEASLRDTISHLSDAIRQSSLTAPESLQAFRTPLVLGLWEQFSDLQKANKELGSLLSSSERSSLMDSLKMLPITEGDATQILNGEMPLDEFFSLTASFTAPEYELSMRQLFASPAFGKLMHEKMRSMFSLTPSKLSDDPNAVSSFYNSLVDKMEELKEASLIAANTNASPIAEKMDGLKQNLDFMQDFNKLFTYLQLPVSLKNQITHGDLYVYTNKKKLLEGQKDISVLLHLDMDQLGPLDIHLSLTGTKVHSKFYTAEKDTARLMQKNVRSLTDRLMEKGFSMTSEFLESKKEPDILKDITDREQTALPIKRYSFDIRA